MYPNHRQDRIISDIKKKWNKANKNPIIINRDSILLEQGFRTYKEYINSPIWRNIRKQVLIRDGFICQKCRKSRAVSVHHLSYDYNTMIGNNLSKLLSVCNKCHWRIEHPYSYRLPIYFPKQYGTRRRHRMFPIIGTNPSY